MGIRSNSLTQPFDKTKPQNKNNRSLKGAGYELSSLELLKICLRCEASCEEAMPQASLTKKNEADEAYFQSPKGSPKMSDFFRFFRRLILCINL